MLFVVPAHIAAGPSIVEGLTGRSIVLPCQVSGQPFPVIQWLRDGASLDNTPSSKFRLLSNGSLQISELRRSDAAAYQCVVSNEGGEDSVTLSLDVHCKMSPCVP